jgi:hypothetical protein
MRSGFDNFDFLRDCHSLNSQYSINGNSDLVELLFSYNMLSEKPR